MALKRKGLSKPILTALFAYKGDSLTLSKLKRFIGKVVARGAGKRAKYLPPPLFYSNPKRLVKQLKPFIEGGIVMLGDSDRQAYD